MRDEQVAWSNQLPHSQGLCFPRALLPEGFASRGLCFPRTLLPEDFASQGLCDLVRGSTADWLSVVPTPGRTFGLSTHLLVDAHRGGELAIFLVFSRFHALADRPVHRR